MPFESCEHMACVTSCFNQYINHQPYLSCYMHHPSGGGLHQCATDRDRLEALIRKASRARFHNSNKTFGDTANSKLFKSVICDPHHVLYPSLPPKPTHTDNLRNRPHNHYIPIKRHALDECNFICRMLYNDCY